MKTILLTLATMLLNSVTFANTTHHSVDDVNSTSLNLILKQSTYICHLKKQGINVSARTQEKVEAYSYYEAVGLCEEFAFDGWKLTHVQEDLTENNNTGASQGKQKYTCYLKLQGINGSMRTEEYVYALNYYEAVGLCQNYAYDGWKVIQVSLKR